MTTFNLLTDAAWPFRRADGSVQNEPIHQLTKDFASNPVVGLAYPRPDFNGAMTECLIGLLQTSMSPSDSRSWRASWTTPPSPEALQRLFEPWLKAFSLFGDGPRFMQDLTLNDGRTSSIGALLIDQPGENTLKENKDLFVKRGRAKALCGRCCGAALFTLQTFAPSGGAGHRTGMRGGGPLSTLILGDTLWHTAWCAVQIEGHLYDTYPDGEDWRGEHEPELLFSWMQACRESKAPKGTPPPAVTPENVHPLHQYWATPRRIRLDYPSPGKTCGICGREDDCVTSYQTKPYGNHYESGWEHPLSPHVLNKDGLPHAIKGKPEGLSYRHWLGFVYDHDADKKGYRAATIVKQVLLQRQEFLLEEGVESPNLRLWIYGYDMDNMKARGYLDQQMPLILVKENPEAFVGKVSQAIKTADFARGLLAKAVIKAFIPKGKTSGDWHGIGQVFYAHTERAFFDYVRSLTRASDHHQAGEAFAAALFHAAFTLFDQYTATRPSDTGNFAWIAKARFQLRSAIHPHGKKFRARLGLPAREQATAPHSS